MSFSSPRPPNAFKSLNNNSGGGDASSSSWTLARSTNTNNQTTFAGNNAGTNQREYASLSNQSGRSGNAQDSSAWKQQPIYPYLSAFPPQHQAPQRQQQQQQQQQQRVNYGYPVSNNTINHQQQRAARQNGRQPQNSPNPMMEAWSQSFHLPHAVHSQQQYYQSRSGVAASNSSNTNGVPYPNLPFWPSSDNDFSPGTAAAPTAIDETPASLLSTAYFPGDVPAGSPPVGSSSTSTRVQFAHRPQQQQQQYPSHHPYQHHIPSASSSSSRGAAHGGGNAMASSPLYGSGRRPMTTTTSSVISSDDGQDFSLQQWNTATNSVVIEPYQPPVQSGRSSASGSSASSSSGYPNGSPQLSARRSTSGNETSGHYGRGSSNSSANHVMAPSRARSGERMETPAASVNSNPFVIDPPSPPPALRQMMQGRTAHSSPPSNYRRSPETYIQPLPAPATNSGRRGDASSNRRANAMPPDMKMPPPLPVVGGSSSLAHETRPSSSNAARIGGNEATYHRHQQQQQQQQMQPQPRPHQQKPGMPMSKPSGSGGSANYPSASSSAPSSLLSDFERFVEESQWYQMAKQTSLARGGSSMKGVNSISTGSKSSMGSVHSSSGSSEFDPSAFHQATPSSYPPLPPPPPHPHQQYHSHQMPASSSSASNRYSDVHNGTHPAPRLAPPPPLPISTFSPSTMAAHRALQMSPTAGLFSPQELFDHQQQQQVMHPGSAAARMASDRFAPVTMGGYSDDGIGRLAMADADDASRRLVKSADVMSCITTSSATSDIASAFDMFGRTIPWSTGGDNNEEKDKPKSSKRAKPSAKANPKRNRPLSSVGEHRLRIKFENMGQLGQYPQKFGRSERYVPDGLRGIHEVYQERWRFEVKHHVRQKSVSVEWIVENLTSGLRTARKESLEESMARESQGRTICNKVLKEALEARAKELEKLLETSEISNLRAISLKDKIKALRPQRCLVGLLFFGLQHKVVQDHMQTLYRARVAGAAPDAHASSANTLAGSDSSAGGDAGLGTTDSNNGKDPNGVSTADGFADHGYDSVDDEDDGDDKEEDNGEEDDGFIKVARPLSSASSSQTAHSRADVQQQEVRETGRGSEQQAQRLPKTTSSSSSSSAAPVPEPSHQLQRRRVEEGRHHSLRVQTENLPPPDLEFTPMPSSSSEDSLLLATMGSPMAAYSLAAQQQQHERRYRVVEHPLGGDQYKYDIQVSPGSPDPRQLPSIDLANVRISSLKPG